MICAWPTPSYEAAHEAPAGEVMGIGEMAHSATLTLCSTSPHKISWTTSQNYPYTDKES